MLKTIACSSRMVATLRADVPLQLARYLGTKGGINSAAKFSDVDADALIPADHEAKPIEPVSQKTTAASSAPQRSLRDGATEQGISRSEGVVAPEADQYETLMSAVYSASAPAKRAIPASLYPSFGEQHTYEAQEFSFANAVWRQRGPAEKPYDKFKAYKIDPLTLWKDPSTLSHYITTNGKIMPGYQHGTSPRNHKRLAKAIRRARAAGLLSTVHRSVDQI